MNSDSGKSKVEGVKFPESIQIQQALEQATAGLPLAMAEASESLGRISEALDVIADYVIRKGKEEGLFSPEEYSDYGAEEGDEDGQPA